MRNQRNRSTSLKPQTSKKPLLFLAGIVLLFVTVRAAYLTGNGSDAQRAQISPQATLIPTPAGKIVAINVNDPDYSFQFPNPQYCQGCFDGDLKPGYRTGEIANQASDYQKPASENWIIQHTTAKKGVTSNGQDWSIPAPSFFGTIAKLNKNESVRITADNDHKSYTFTRLEDRTIDGVTASMYQSNMTTGHGTQTKYAVFTKGDYLYLLSVEWASDANNYIFDLVTSSFRFSLRPESEVMHN